MKITVAAFYADVIGRPSRFADYLPLAVASRRALALTNPGARYVVLTDSLTAARFAPHGVECAIMAPEHMPLMEKVIFAQRAFLAHPHPDLGADPDLIVLPDVDCLANRALDEAMPANAGLAVTHKGPKFRRRINNVAYVRDRQLGVRFLDAAYRVLEGWPMERRQWGGDQDAWGEVLGDPAHWAPGEAAERWIACTAVGTVDVYPCATHNRPLADDGGLRKRHRQAFMIHLKGPRKQHLERFMAARFGEAGYDREGSGVAIAGAEPLASASSHKGGGEDTPGLAAP
jgi:hypothetical protein